MFFVGGEGKLKLSATVKSKYLNSRSFLGGFIAFVLLPQEIDYFTVEPTFVITCTNYESEKSSMIAKLE